MDYLPNIGFPKLANVWESHLVKRAGCKCTFLHWCWRLQSLPTIPRADLLQNGLVGSPCSPRDSQESSPTPQFKSINSSALSLLHRPTLTHRPGPEDHLQEATRYTCRHLDTQWLKSYCSTVWGFFGHMVQLAGTLAWQWNCQVLTTALPGNSLHDLSLEAFKSASSVTCLWCREGSSMFWPSFWY